MRRLGYDTYDTFVCVTILVIHRQRVFYILFRPGSVLDQTAQYREATQKRLQMPLPLASLLASLTPPSDTLYIQSTRPTKS